MVGSAAARHAARTGHSVALIGPAEVNRSDADAWAVTEVFGAHYDEGRITRKTDPDPVWATLAARSVERYGEIVEDAGGGFGFYHEVGHLAVGAAGSTTVEDRKANAAAMGVGFEALDAEALATRFPYLAFGAGAAGVYEPREAGYVSARGLVAAQTAAASRMGAVVVPRAAVAVEPVAAHLSGGLNAAASLYDVFTDDGAAVRSKRVLVAAGAFTNDRPLLPISSEASTPGGVDFFHATLDLRPATAQTVHFLLGEADAERLAGMPSVIVKDENLWAYVLPPIRYPDGTTRLKLGGARWAGVQVHAQALEEVVEAGKSASEAAMAAGKRPLRSADEVVAWYRGGGDPAATAEMEEMMRTLVPGLDPTTPTLSDACVTCHTPTGQAFVGEIAPGLCVATGGNGLAAKSSDEIGRLGALCALSPEAWGRERIAGRPTADVLRPVLKETARVDNP